MNRIANIIVKYPRSIILCCSLVTLAAAFGMTRLETRNNYEGDLPASDPIIRTNARFEEVFGNEQIMMVAVESEDLFSPASLEKIAQISGALATVQGVAADGIASLATLPAPRNDGQHSEASLLSALLARPEAIDTYRKQLLAEGSPARSLISEDGSTTQILVRVSRTADQATVARQVREIIHRFEGPERLYTVGDFIVAQEIDDGIEGDLHILLPLAVALVLLGFFVSFRSLRGTILPLLVILISIVWTLGLMGYLGFDLNVVTSTIPILLVATASSYGIHVIHRYNSESHRGETAIRHALQRLGLPVLLTGITSGIGTLTLLLFQVNSIREFGMFAAAGIGSAMLLAIVLLPAILTLLKQPPKQPEHRSRSIGERLLLSLGRFSLNHGRLVLVVTLLLIVASGIGITRIRLGLDPVELFPEGHPVRKATRVFNDRFSGVRYFNVMVEGDEPNVVKHPTFLQSLIGFQRAAGKVPDVSRSESVIDALRHLHSTVHRQHPVPFSIPDSEQEIEAAFDLLSGSAGERELTAWVDEDYRRARITVMITATDHEEQLRIYRRLQDLARVHFPEDVRVAFGGSVLIWIAQNHYVAIGKVYNIAAAIFLVFAFCMFAFRSAAKGLLSVIPLTIATLLTFGIMGFCGIRLNMATAIITSMAVGIGVDFAIHFFTRLQEERANGHAIEEATQRTMLTAGKAILFDVASNVLGFIVFAFSGFSPIQNLGLLVSLTMLTCAFGSLVLLPPLTAFAWKKAPPLHHHRQLKALKSLSQDSRLKFRNAVGTPAGAIVENVKGGTARGETVTLRLKEGGEK